MPYGFTLMWILRNLTETHEGGEEKKKAQSGREPKHKKLLKTENRLRADSGWVMGIEEGTFWDEHWVLYGNQFDNKLKKKDS